MRADMSALRGIKIPSQFLPVPNMRPEWLVAGCFSVIWISALGTYGAGYFGWFSSSPVETRFLDVILYVSALAIPLLTLWCGAWMMRQTNRVAADTARLQAVVRQLQDAVALASPAQKDDVIRTVEEAVGAAMRTEQKRLTTQFRNLSEEQRQIAEAVRMLLKARGQEHEAIAELVETAQGVATKAAQKAQAADKVVNLAIKANPAMDANAHQQPDLPLEAAPMAPQPGQPEWDHVVRALNFPQSETDTAGFKSIRKVLPFREIAQLLQGAEDILSMLAQEGIYMDDLTTEDANPALWHRFAAGARGAELDDMGTVLDHAAITLAQGRMRSDPVFMDSALHFLRLFDRFLQAHIKTATDLDIVALADTRTGRAFQLLARIGGTFN